MPTVPSSGSGSGFLVSTRRELTGKVAALKGFSMADPSLVQRVEQFLDDTIKDLNTLPWESSKTVENPTLVANQQYVTLSTNFFKSSLVYLVNDTTGDQVPMTEIPYVPFKRQFWRTNTDASNSGIPRIYTVFNYEKTRRMQFDAAPSTECVADYTLAVEFYRRIPLITSVPGDTAPDIPDYLENVITYGAMKRLCAHVEDGAGVQIYEALEAKALDHARRIDIMQPDADHRFRLSAEVASSPYRRYAFWGFNPF